MSTVGPARRRGRSSWLAAVARLSGGASPRHSRQPGGRRRARRRQRQPQMVGATIFDEAVPDSVSSSGGSAMDSFQCRRFHGAAATFFRCKRGHSDPRRSAGRQGPPASWGAAPPPCGSRVGLTLLSRSAAVMRSRAGQVPGHRSDRTTIRCDEINCLPLVVVRKRPTSTSFHPTPPGSSSHRQVSIFLIQGFGQPIRRPDL